MLDAVDLRVNADWYCCHDDVLLWLVARLQGVVTKKSPSHAQRVRGAIGVSRDYLAVSAVTNACNSAS
jgi:hypothetical protein